MATKVYGASDDLIEFDGDVDGEVGAFGTDDEDSPGVLIMFSDGTLATAKYGKNDEGLWELKVLKPGTLFDRREEIFEETQDGHSDVLHFRDGLTWAYAAKGDWEKVA